MRQNKYSDFHIQKSGLIFTFSFAHQKVRLQDLGTFTKSCFPTPFNLSDFFSHSFYIISIARQYLFIQIIYSKLTGN